MDTHINMSTCKDKCKGGGDSKRLFPGAELCPTPHLSPLHVWSESAVTLWRMSDRKSLENFYNLALNWFLSIKLKTDNRLMRAVKRLRFLTTASISVKT